MYSVVSGTLKYVDDYTGFSGDPALQEGNYLALRVDTDDEDDVITAELLGGSTGHPVTLDSDRNIVFLIADEQTQRIRFVITHTNEDDTESERVVTLSLKGLTLESPENDVNGIK